MNKLFIILIAFFSFPVYAGYGTGGLGYTPVADTNGSITSALGYTPIQNSIGSITSVLGYTPVANTNGSITAALGYTPVNINGGTITGNIGATGNIYSTLEGSVKLQRSPMGEVWMQGNATSTTIAVSGVYVKAMGVTTLDSDSYLFGTSNANNKLVYIGTATKHYHIAMTATYSAGNNDTIGIAIAKNGTITGMQKSIIKDKVQTGGDLESSAIHVATPLNTNDFLEVFVSNLSDTDSVTVSTMNLFAMGMSMGED